jgi:hypothetical protein
MLGCSFMKRFWSNLAGQVRGNCAEWLHGGLFRWQSHSNSAAPSRDRRAVVHPSLWIKQRMIDHTRKIEHAGSSGGAGHFHSLFGNFFHSMLLSGFA